MPWTQVYAPVMGTIFLTALLIVFSFGTFIEGAAGFGTPGAISAAMLIGLGFRPPQAVSCRSASCGSGCSSASPSSTWEVNMPLP